MDAPDGCHFGTLISGGRGAPYTSSPRTESESDWLSVVDLMPVVEILTGKNRDPLGEARALPLHEASRDIVDAVRRVCKESVGSHLNLADPQVLTRSFERLGLPDLCDLEPSLSLITNWSTYRIRVQPSTLRHD